jgi:hypothetical protein
MKEVILKEEVSWCAAFINTKAVEIGKRDHWTCRGLDHQACHYGHNGSAASFQTGYIVNAAHERDIHSPNWDRDINKGRILCQVHHAMEELQRGNIYGAQEILKRGIYTQNHLKDYQIEQEVLSVEDIFSLMIKDGMMMRNGRALLEEYLPEGSWQRISLPRQY